MENSTNSLFAMIEKLLELVKELRAEIAYLKRHASKSDILDETAFQQEFGVTRGTGYNLRKKRKVVSFTIGKRIYYSRSLTIAQAIAENTKSNQLTLF